MVAEEFGVGIVPDVPVIHTLPVKILNIENLHCRRYIYMGMMKTGTQVRLWSSSGIIYTSITGSMK